MQNHRIVKFVLFILCVIVVMSIIAYSIISKNADKHNQNNQKISEAEAINIAENSWLSIYGNKIYDHTPFVAIYNEKAKTWFVRGSLQRGFLGGVPEIVIDAMTGEVIRVTHGK